MVTRETKVTFIRRCKTDIIILQTKALFIRVVTLIDRIWVIMFICRTLTSFIPRIKTCFLQRRTKVKETKTKVKQETKAEETKTQVTVPEPKVLRRLETS